MTLLQIMKLFAFFYFCIIIIGKYLRRHALLRVQKFDSGTQIAALLVGGWYSFVLTAVCDGKKL